jgi:hypothetical protein
MSAPATRRDEILLCVAPPAGVAQTGPRTRAYDVFVYSGVTTPLGYRSADLPEGRPAEVGGLPFAGREEIAIRWTRYPEYLRLFQEYATNPRAMAERLVETVTDGLRTVLERPPSGTRPLRIWWSLEAPELEELPWELLTPGAGTATATSIVRGAPGEVPSLLPIQNGLRLAIVGDALAASPPLADVLRSPAPAITSRWLSGDARQQLLEVAKEGFELVHLVADGWVSLGMDAVLDFGHGQKNVSRSELAAAFCGSRVTVLALSPPRAPQALLGVPHAYRAFAHLAGEELDQSVVATIGPAQPPQEGRFWRTFYETLSSTLSVESAVAAGREAEPAFAAALYLRHRLGAAFSRRPAPAGATPEPARVSAELRASRRFVEQLRALDARYVPADARAERNPLLEKARAQQESLESSLEPLRRTDVDEP